MADQDSGAVARTLVEAAFSGNFERARACCTPDVELTIEGTQTVYGHDGLRHVMEFNAEVSAGVLVKIHHVLGAGDTAALNRTTRLHIGGEQLTLEVGAFFTLREGLVCEWTDYQDLQEVARALGH